MVEDLREPLRCPNRFQEGLRNADMTVLEETTWLPRQTLQQDTHLVMRQVMSFSDKFENNIPAEYGGELARVWRSEPSVDISRVDRFSKGLHRPLLQFL